MGNSEESSAAQEENFIDIDKESFKLISLEVVNRPDFSSSAVVSVLEYPTNNQHDLERLAMLEQASGENLLFHASPKKWFPATPSDPKKGYGFLPVRSEKDAATVDAFLHWRAIADVERVNPQQDFKESVFYYDPKDVVVDPYNRGKYRLEYAMTERKYQEERRKFGIENERKILELRDRIHRKMLMAEDTRFLVDNWSSIEIAVLSDLQESMSSGVTSSTDSVKFEDPAVSAQGWKIYPRGYIHDAEILDFDPNLGPKISFAWNFDVSVGRPNSTNDAVSSSVPVRLSLAQTGIGWKGVSLGREPSVRNGHIVPDFVVNRNGKSYRVPKHLAPEYVTETSGPFLQQDTYVIKNTFVAKTPLGEVTTIAKYYDPVSETHDFTDPSIADMKKEADTRYLLSKLMEADMVALLVNEATDESLLNVSSDTIVTEFKSITERLGRLSTESRSHSNYMQVAEFIEKLPDLLDKKSTWYFEQTFETVKTKGPDPERPYGDPGTRTIRHDIFYIKCPDKATEIELPLSNAQEAEYVNSLIAAGKLSHASFFEGDRNEVLATLLRLATVAAENTYDTERLQGTVLKRKVVELEHRLYRKLIEGVSSTLDLETLKPIAEN